MRKSFHLTVLTPERALLEARGVTQIQAQLADGGPIGIYPGHAPLLAETVAAPLRYADASGEHTIDLDAGILQVESAGVTVFVNSAKPSEENDRHFDQLAQELLTNLNAQPDDVLNTDQRAERNQV